MDKGMVNNRYKYIDEKREHLHTLDGKPLFGTSTVSKEFTSIPLWYGSGKAVEVFGIPNYKDIKGYSKLSDTEKDALIASIQARRREIMELNDEEYLDLLLEAYRAHDEYKKTRGKEGTNRHEVLENYINSCKEGVPYLAEGDKFLVDFSSWAVLNVEKFLFSEKHCYSETLWLGGIMDAGALLKDGKLAMMDFKSAKDAYLEHFIQCALYDLQIQENGVLTPDGEQLIAPYASDVYLVVPFGAPEFVVKPCYDVEGLREDAKRRVQCYAYKQNFV